MRRGGPVVVVVVDDIVAGVYTAKLEDVDRMARRNDVRSTIARHQSFRLYRLAAAPSVAACSGQHVRVSDKVADTAADEAGAAVSQPVSIALCTLATTSQPRHNAGAGKLAHISVDACSCRWSWDQSQA